MQNEPQPIPSMYREHGYKIGIFTDQIYSRMQIAACGVRNYAKCCWSMTGNSWLARELGGCPIQQPRPQGTAAALLATANSTNPEGAALHLFCLSHLTSTLQNPPATSILSPISQHFTSLIGLSFVHAE